ncbi:MAG: AIR synthase-related protein [Oligoflexia bacterium]|nr:AIR synthase-related protein [Oligoflexia bacterium]
MTKTTVRIEVRDLDSNYRENSWVANAKDDFQIPLFGVEMVRIYWVGTDQAAEETEIKLWAEQVFSDPILNAYSFKHDEGAYAGFSMGLNPQFAVQVRFRPGVTDNVAKSSVEALQICSEFTKNNQVSVSTGKVFYFYGDVNKSQVEKIATESLGNSLIEEILVEDFSDYFRPERFENQKLSEVHLEGGGNVEVLSLEKDIKHLEKLSKEKCWALSGAELTAIKAYFAREEIQKKREEKGLSASPTDVEMEIIAQTWSEHCKHKIFASEIDYIESVAENLNRDIFPVLEPQTIKSVFKTYIKKTTDTVREQRNLPWLVSVFSDNAGIVRFDKNIDLCIKVETHNSPSALDPYGGALTGIVGVNRDILGCGMGSRPIANTDVFCFGQPDWPSVGDDKELPDGLKHPKRIFSGVHLGIEDGGNKSGIPTVNGAIHFHRNYCGKPLVFCGTIGVTPPKLANGLEGASKNQKSGDRIVMAGGRIGKDGIHGATFSSMELTEGAPATVVQIGDPITQKRLADFLLEARDLGLYSSVTDNGAGGLSSSVGEMATLSHGAQLDVTHVPTKYPGLEPYELVVSESQERMTFSVPEEKFATFKALAEKRNVEIADVGVFTNSGVFEVLYAGKTIAYLDLDFLHEGNPPMVLKAKWMGPKEEQLWTGKKQKQKVDPVDYSARKFIEDGFFKLLSSWNIRSKEAWVRRYDHEVQAATVQKPFVGTEGVGPGDAGVIWLRQHGGEDYNGISISCGIAPQLSRYDTYVMAQHALDEAIRNSVAVGADPEMVALTDNFCWPDPIATEKNPDGSHKLAQLVRANKGLFDLAVAYGAPFVSGKDSMKNDFIGKGVLGKEIKISVPPTVLVSCMARVPDVRNTVNSAFKNEGDLVYLVGKNQSFMGGAEISEFYEFPEAVIEHPPIVYAEENFRIYRTIHKAMQLGLLESCHDCSEGGMLVSLAESCIGGNLGFDGAIDEIETLESLYEDKLSHFFFNESPGRFVVSVTKEKAKEFESLFSGQEVISLGTVTQEIIRFTKNGLVYFDVPVQRAKQIWRGAHK